MSSCCEWQPISTAPRDGRPLLVFHTAWDLMQVGVCYGETQPWQQPSGDLLQTPMYWMALPRPPLRPPGSDGLTAE
ncbi:hypothetical protein M446_3381 [Methylobacterium sp. 4-46]|uniref:hypothetical protein n=1 Tax=unclassified Methylobacterium TaxID=2615210 RepID=UPI000165C75C|nr:MULTISPECIES: hypothetical protein [Methylobacterium]ACA17771.1 hypothetical protein M446_3381 [Methylobacterium sp. 4-46]WFT83440.1 hypothetical protein QA634_17115 [Methylobacterium nodulans]